MSNKTKMLVVIPFFALVFAILPLVSADTCVGQNCNATINLTIGNVAPTIPYVAPVSAVTLNGGTTKNVYVEFNATDDNGYADLNFATAQVKLVNGIVTRTSSVCSPIVNTTFTSTLNCTIALNFYDDAGVWTINATISDSQSIEAVNSTTSLTVNALDYVTQDVTYFNWGSATLGTDDVEAGNPITLTNGGNQDYATLNIKGQNATGVNFADVINANRFSVDDQSGQTTGQIYMVANTNVDVSSILNLNSHGAVVTELIYAYVDVPSGIRADNYLSNTAWTISLS